MWNESLDKPFIGVNSALEHFTQLSACSSG